MRERLREYIGVQGTQVRISTFHSFAIELIQDYFGLLGFSAQPALLDDTQSIVLFDELLESHDWEYLRPRGGVSRYFYDMKSLVSLLKRERISPEEFGHQITHEITSIKESPDSISSRGPTKGQMKKDMATKIDGLKRSLEFVEFYKIYETEKKNRNAMDYDDVLACLVELVNISEDVRARLREQYLYVLVDEHQDSSGIQNEFLARVWSDQETQNIFVVGDDRQLIYGFGGASLHHFTSFKEMFPKSQVLTLTDNYRSTQIILDTAELLLQSSLAEGKLQSHRDGDDGVRLVEAEFPRDEIILAGIDIKKKIEQGIDPNECAILVPKNKHVKNAITILEDMDIPIASGRSLHVFELPETESLLRILSIIADPMNPALVAGTLFDPLSGVPPLEAHLFVSGRDMRKFAITDLVNSLENSFVGAWGKKLERFVTELPHKDVYDILQAVGGELLLSSATDHDTLTRRIEIVRTLLHVVLQEKEKNPRMRLTEFVETIARLREYGTDIPLAVFGSEEGVKVMTLHGSKGLEFEFVWIAHVDEKSLMSGKRLGFAVPETIAHLIEEKDEETVKRELYVALTRAKRFCTLSYARKGYTGVDQVLSPCLTRLLDGQLKRISSVQSEQVILSTDQKLYVAGGISEKDLVGSKELATMVSKEYDKRSVSVTLLNNFFECPWKWYFRSFLQLPEPKNESLIFGSLVHSTIEDILKQKREPGEGELDSYIEKNLDRERVFDESRARYKKEALATLRVWVEKRLPGILSHSFESERAISYRDPEFIHLLVTGKIDLAEYEDDFHVRVTDFKTGGGKKKSDIEKTDDDGRLGSYMRQLAMYSYLLHGASKGNITVAESKLEFVEESPDAKEYMYSTTLSSDHVQLLVKDIEEYDEALKTGSWVNRTCCAKLYNGKTECDYCRMARIYLGTKEV
jgi:DNA helicase-2/ATP-dependent DNA helicase PcrA